MQAARLRNINRYEREDQSLEHRERRWDMIQRARRRTLAANGYSVG